MKVYLKCLALMISIALLACACTSCKRTTEPSHEIEALNIYTSFYPIYALAELIVEGVPDINLHCLVQPQDGCLRNYQLSDWDLTLLSRSADVVIIGGRGLESFENTLYNLGENGPAVASVLYNKELISQESDSVSDGENHWKGINPHLYMSPEGAILIAESIAAQLSALDPSNSDAYFRNLELANEKLRSIADSLKQTSVRICDSKVILMTETAVYIAKDLGLDPELKICRDSGESYYGNELEKLIKQLNECESKVILIEEQAPERFCEALEDAGFALAKIDTFSTKRADEGAQDYFEGMQTNILAVEKAFEQVIE